MVIRTSQYSRERGFAMAEMMVAIGILILTMLPLSFSIHSDARLFRATYQRAVAMEIVDGEMEILAAGAWRNVAPGEHSLTVHAAAAANLPPGEFKLTRTGGRLRLEWKSAKKLGIGPVVREADLP